MKRKTVVCIPRGDAVRRAGDYLKHRGLLVTRKAAPDVTHLLLPVPSFSTGDDYLAHLLADLPEDVIVSGGNLSSLLLKNYTTVDFLRDPYYLAENAAITAACAIELVEKILSDPLDQSSILIAGWGRIGKCLWQLLDKKGCSITVAARKDTDRAMIRSFGARGISFDEAATETASFDVILNTVPAMVLPALEARDDAVVLELASKPGISGRNIINGRGLPGKMAPEKSGRLIADTFLRLALGTEV